MIIPHKRSIAAKQRARQPMSDETKKRISVANTGKRRTDASKRLMSDKKLGKTLEEIYGVDRKSVV